VGTPRSNPSVARESAPVPFPEWAARDVGVWHRGTNGPRGVPARVENAQCRDVFHAGTRVFFLFLAGDRWKRPCRPSRRGEERVDFARTRRRVDGWCKKRAHTSCATIPGRAPPTIHRLIIVPFPKSRSNHQARCRRKADPIKTPRSKKLWQRVRLKHAGTNGRVAFARHSRRELAHPRPAWTLSAPGRQEDRRGFVPSPNASHTTR